MLSQHKTLLACCAIALMTSACVTGGSDETASADKKDGPGLRGILMAPIDAISGWLGDAPDIENSALVMAQASLRDVDIDDIPAAEWVTADVGACTPEKKPLDDPFEAGFRDLYLTQYGHIPLAETEAYLNSILHRLVACAPFEPQKARVVITPQDSLSGYVSSDGLISVSLQTLFPINKDGVTYQPSDEALAFLIAHEYGHILMRHYERSKATGERARIFTMLKETAYLADDYLRDILPDTAEDVDADNKMDDPLLVNETFDIMFEHAFGRQNEFEADLIGLHLTHLAGYNALSGANNFLSGLQTQTSLEARIEKLTQNRAQAALTDLQTGQVLQEGYLDSFQDNFVGEVEDFVGQTLKQTHPDPQERIALITAYSEQHGLEFDITKLFATSALFDSAEFSDHKTNKSLVDTWTGVQQSWEIYRALMDNPDQADEWVEKARKSISTNGRSDIAFLRYNPVAYGVCDNPYASRR